MTIPLKSILPPLNRLQTAVIDNLQMNLPSQPEIINLCIVAAAHFDTKQINSFGVFMFCFVFLKIPDCYCITKSIWTRKTTEFISSRLKNKLKKHLSIELLMISQEALISIILITTHWEKTL